MKNIVAMTGTEVIRIGGYESPRKRVLETVVKAIFGIVLTILFIAASVLCTLMAAIGLTYINTESCMLNPTACWGAFAGGVMLLLLIVGLEKLLFEDARKILHWQFKVASIAGFLIGITTAGVAATIMEIDDFWLSRVVGWSTFISFWYSVIAND